MNALIRIAADPALAVRASARVGRVCELLDMEESQVRRLLNEGEIEGHGLGRRGLRVFLDSVAAYQLRKAREPRPRNPQDKPAKPTRKSSAGLAAQRSAMAELQRRGLAE